MWEITFKIVGDTGEVIVNQLWVDVVTHKNSEEAQGFGSGVNGAVMEMAESKIGVGAGIVRRFGGVINSVAESDGAFVHQTLVRPWLPNRLPGQCGLKVHCEEAPSASRGGVNGCMMRLGRDGMLERTSCRISHQQWCY